MSLTTNVVLIATVTGINGAGAITLTGAKVGDIVFSTRNVTSGVDWDGTLEGSISVADQVQQVSAQNLTSNTITVFLFRPTTIVSCVASA